MKTRQSILAGIATIATLCLGSLLAHAQTTTPTQLPWYTTDGQPGIKVGKQIGFFIWHVGSEVYLATTNENAKGDTFSGTITVANGTISDPDGVYLEKNDSLKQVNPTTLQFEFHTYQGLDMVKFQISGGVSNLNFKLEMDGKMAPYIFLGAKMTEAAQYETTAGLYFVRHPDIITPIPWSLTSGAPNILTGKQVGYFLWHDDHYVYLVCTDESDTMQYFDGEVRVHGGTIEDVTLANADSKVVLLNPSVMRWYFKTAEGLSGVRFEISKGATRVGFTFHLDGMVTHHVFLGKNEIEAPRNEDDDVVFDMTK